jgi:hypothetical protein
LSAGCRHDDKVSSSPTPKATRQRDVASAPATAIYAGGSVTIRRATDDRAHACISCLLRCTKDGAVEILGDLPSILEYIAPEMLSFKVELPKGKYVVCVAPPDKKMDEEALITRAWTLIVPAYEKAFGVNVRHVSRTEEVFVLQVQESGLRNVKKAKESDSVGSGTWRNGYEFRGHSFAKTADFLTGKLDVFVLDETGDKEKYTFEVPVDVFHLDDAQNWIDGLKKVGLVLQKKNRKIGYTLIENMPSKAHTAPHH